MDHVLAGLQSALEGRYVLERELGRGGMATVYLARDSRHRRLVALKVLRQDLAAALGPERFLREIEIAAQLQHPHILPLFDSGQAAGQLWYTMPYVEGESLRDRLDSERQLPLDDALRIATAVAAALDYAHRHHVVHRDIKPENVLLHEGEALVTDFGIAKAISAAGGETLTQTGMVVGTPAYMSPEQASGEAVDARSDIYSLGCMLYEMLAGQKPFTGPTVQAIIAKHFTEPVPSLRAARSTVPESVERAVTKALAKTPADRFATAAQLAQAIAALSVSPPAPTGPSPESVPFGVKSIAVLPFSNMSADPDNEYFTDGMAEEIINALTKIQALRVASRTSSFAFKGKNQDITEIGRKLKVATALEGSVRKVGNRLRVTAQLINVADGYHLWSERYDRNFEDVFAVQDDIAESIVKALRVVLSEDEKRAIQKVPTANVQAYDYYLRGRQFFHQLQRKSLEFARRMFARAIEVDPGYALAYAGMADCSSQLYMGFDARESHLRHADTASRKALELDPELAEAHAARGFALSLGKRFDEAEDEFETAMRLDPKLYEAPYFYGRACRAQGKLEKAARLFKRASEVRPEDHVAPSFLGDVYTNLGRKAEAAEAWHRSLHLAEQRLELNPDDARALNFGATTLGKIGDFARALDWARQSLAIDPEDALILYNVACVYSLLGRMDEAIAYLEKAVDNGFGHKDWIEHDTDLDPLRGLPRFQALVERM